ncbi:MAG: 30S ribosomal protein S9 [Chlamydiales bacterium]
MEEKLGVGRRKRAVASVRLRKGSGKVTVNGRKHDEYFPLDFQREIMLSPLKKFELDSTYDILVSVKGGGIEAQATAVRLGISRALVSDDEGKRGELKELGYLTRDPRRKERKKYGQRGARAKFQFSKR